MVDYQWPGNIRELENTIERMVILSHGDEITVDDLPAEVRRATACCVEPAGVRCCPTRGSISRRSRWTS